MSSGVYPYQYEEEKSDLEITSQAGLPLYLEFADSIKLLTSIRRHMKVRTHSQGWTDEQIIISLILLNITGGKSVSDLRLLESDRGLCRILQRTPTYRFPPKAPGDSRSNYRWPQGRKRIFPSDSAAFRYLSAFHDPAQEELRRPHKAFIPQPNSHLRSFHRINRDLVHAVQSHAPKHTATMDMDATLVPTQKQEALYCYKGYKAYQPVNVWWFEQNQVLFTEFRDGNVPASFELLRVFKHALHALPDTVKRVRLRSDSAGYQHALLSYCEKGQNHRFGRIEFVVGCNVSPEFKQAVREVEPDSWQPFIKEVDGMSIQTGQEWAEVCFVPEEQGLCSGSPVYRYLALREPYEETKTRKEEEKLPFQTIQLEDKKFKLFGRVTNREEDGNFLLNWLNGRGGKSEEAHSVMKTDLAGGKLPSGDFGENAAWWWVMILALNLNNALKSLVLGKKKWGGKRLKGLRFELIHLQGRVVRRSRQTIIRLEKGGGHARVQQTRARIVGLMGGPSP